MKIYPVAQKTNRFNSIRNMRNPEFPRKRYIKQRITQFAFACAGISFSIAVGVLMYLMASRFFEEKLK